MQATERRKPGASSAFMPPARAGAGKSSPPTRFAANLSGVPSQDQGPFRIAAIPDVSLREFQPIPVAAHFGRNSVTSVAWRLVDPEGNDVATAKTPSFTIERAHLVDTGKFHLHCTGFDARGNTIESAVRDFNVVGAPMTTGVQRHGRFGTMVFREYEPHTPKGQRAYLKVKLAFIPYKEIGCRDVRFAQAVQMLAPDGRTLFHTVHKDIDARASAEGWAIDREEGARSPFYPGDAGGGGPFERPALLDDTPQVDRDTITRYESCAICRSGEHKGQVYACATWGFTYDGTNLEPMPRDVREEPSDEFRGAAAEWNAQRKRMREGAEK